MTTFSTNSLAIMLTTPVLIFITALWWFAFVHSKTVFAMAINVVILEILNVLMVVMERQWDAAHKVASPNVTSNAKSVFVLEDAASDGPEQLNVSSSTDINSELQQLVIHDIH